MICGLIESTGGMFLRDRVPSEGERKVARGIRTGHFVGIVIFTAVINVSVAAHLVTSGPSSEWIWLQVLSVIVLFAAIGGLVWVSKKAPVRRSNSD